MLAHGENTSKCGRYFDGSEENNAYLPSLTSLRGIAALWVATYHYGYLYFPNIGISSYTKIVDKGYLAVDLFFILSGFVMTHVYRDSFQKNIWRNYWGFFKARIARVYPLHLVVLVLFLITALGARFVNYVATGSFEMFPLEGARSLSALIANIFMVQGLRAKELSWNYPAWSISVEFIAYLIFPLALCILWRASRLWKLVMTFGLLAAIGWLAWLTRDDFNQWDGPLVLLRCLPEFLLGAVLYLVFRRGFASHIIAKDVVILVFAALTIGCLHFGAPDFAIVLMFALLVIALVANSGKATSILNARPLVRLGEISYAFYLLHGFVEYVTTGILVHSFGITDRLSISPYHSLILTAAMVAAALLLASLSYEYIEVPARRYLRQSFLRPVVVTPAKI